jgi:hypothetical protein
VKFTGCESDSLKCSSPSPAVAGEIVTLELKGKLGVIDAATEEVGEDLVGTGRVGLAVDLVTDFKCGANEFEAVGSVIAVVTPINAKASAKSTRTFTAVGSKQEPENFEGEPKDIFETEINSLAEQTFPFPSTEQTTEEVTSKSYETRF